MVDRRPDVRGSGRPAAGAVLRTLGRLALGIGLVGAGAGHLTFARQEFQAQVPSWFPADADLVVLASGVVEIALGAALVLASSRWRPAVGLAAAGFFVGVFPGNIAQWVEHRDGFGLDTDTARFVRLFFQPVLVVIALWSTGGWRWLRRRLATSTLPSEATLEDWEEGD